MRRQADKKGWRKLEKEEQKWAKEREDRNRVQKKNLKRERECTLFIICNQFSSWI
jgi:hypothetical protein